MIFGSKASLVMDTGDNLAHNTLFSPSDALHVAKCSAHNTLPEVRQFQRATHTS